MKTSSKNWVAAMVFFGLYVISGASAGIAFIGVHGKPSTAWVVVETALFALSILFVFTGVSAAAAETKAEKK